MGNQALQNLSGGMQDVFAPIYGQAQNLWQQQIMPQTMERFAGMGAAMGGGAESALAREGQNLSTNLGATLAPLWMQSQLALPGLAQGMGGWEQANRQGSLTDLYQQWQRQQPYSNPYLNLAQGAMPGGAAYTNYATQSQPSFGNQLLTGMGTNLAQNPSSLLTGMTSLLGSVGSAGSAGWGTTAGMLGYNPTIAAGAGGSGLLGGIGSLASAGASGIGSILSAIGSLI